MYYYLPENDAYCPSQCPCLPGIEGQSKLSRKDSIRVKLECSLSEKKVRHVISSISARAPIACKVDRSCLHKQMKLPSGHSIGSFYTSHFISIIPLSITAREAWNLSVVDESERNTANFIWVTSRGSAPCYFTDISWQLTNQTYGIVVLTFVGGQFHVVKLALNFNRTELDGFLFEIFAWK